MEKQLYDLTLSQQVLLVSQKYSLQKQVLNVPISCLVEREMNFDLLRKAVEIAFSRSDALHLKIIKQGKNIVQYFSDDEKPEIGFIDCTGMNEEKEYRTLLKVAQKNVHCVDKPLYRFNLVRNRNGWCGVMVVVSHMIMDGWGVNMFIKDIFGIYSHLEGKAEMPPTPYPFKDELLRELEYAKSEQHQKDLAWWKNEWLTHKPVYTHPVTNKRLVKARKKKPDAVGCANFVLDTRGSHVICDVNKKLVDAIEAFCAKNHVSPSILFDMAVTTIIAKVNGTDSCSISSAAAMRSKLSQRNTGGSMLGTHLLRYEYDWNASAISQLSSNYQHKMGAMRHFQPAYLETWTILNEIYGLKQIETVSSVSVSFQPLPLALGGYNKVHTRWYPTGVGNQPILLEVMDNDGNGGWRVYYEIQPAHIKPDQTETMHRRVLEFFRLMVEDASRPLCRIMDEVMKVQ